MEKTVNQIVEEWIAANPDAPKDVVEWLKRPPNVPPHVTDDMKLRYMQEHRTMKAMFDDLSRPAKITKVNSIEEAMQITLDDLKKGQQ